MLVVFVLAMIFFALVGEKSWMSMTFKSFLVAVSYVFFQGCF